LPARGDVPLAAGSLRPLERTGPRSPAVSRLRLETAKDQPAKKRLPWPVVLFLIGLVIPWIIPLGPLNLSVYRLVLLATVLPCVVMWASGKAGPIRAADIGLLLYSGWAGVTLIKAQGAASAVQPVGIFFVETMGAYLLARCYIRDAEDFENVIALFTKLVILLLPFAVYEWLTASKPLLSAFGAVFPTVEVTLMQPRLGFWRVQGPFAHSIAFGLFCGSTFALTYLVLGKGRNSASGRVMTALVAATAILSMSSAPIAGLFVQCALLCWNWLLRQYRSRWKILWALAFAAYLVVEFGSNQTPIQFYIKYFTFDQQTGWFRIWIWEYGSASVLNHPLFGIGFGDWVRPKWMAPDSIDNFWLVTAVRHGIPAFLLLFGSCLGTTSAVALKSGLDEKLQNYRVAYLICMATYFIVGTTAHFWGAPYVWFLFLLGSGVWLLDVKPGEAAPLDETDRNIRRRSSLDRHRAGRSSRPGRGSSRTRKA